MKRTLKIHRLAEEFGFGSALELWIATVLFLLQALLKIWNVFHYRFDSDESQHLHVVWAWTHGLVQYRDVFDNHMPLFHLVCAPLLGLLGEQTQTLYWMRLLMVPLYFLSLWCIYRIGDILFGRRIGIWAVLLAGSIDAYQFCSTEFRPDNLWVVLWLLVLLLIVRGPLSLRTLITSGLLLGLAYSVSMKTTVMFLALVSAVTIVCPLGGWQRLGLTTRKAAAYGGVFLAGVVAVPLVILLFFAAKGAWPQFRYCVFEHNLFVTPTYRYAYINPLGLFVAVPLLIYGAGQIIRTAPDPSLGFRRAFLFVASGGYLSVLRCLWRHVTREDSLAYYPLFALLCAAALFALSRTLQNRWRTSVVLWRVPLAAIVAFALTVFSLIPHTISSNRANQEISLVGDVLTLTDPTDYVFDCKGETVFRSRCTYHVLERLTLDRMRYGLIRDDIRDGMVEKRACVAVMRGELPSLDRSFINANYIKVGRRVRVVGSLFPSSPNENIHFHIAIPASYEIVAQWGQASATLDGSPYTGARFLDVGEHELLVSESTSPLAVIWAQAADRHFSPF